MNRKDIDMLHGPLARNILIYAIPVILTSYLQLLFNAADLVVVGRFCGSVSVAAVGATGSLTHLITTLFMGLSVGAGVAVAHAIGSREEENVRRTVHTAMFLALVSGVVLTFFGVGCSDALLKMMSTPKNVFPLASLYVRIYFYGILFTMVYNFATAILRAAGDTRSPLLILFAAGVINVVLNVIFVTALDMNVAGVAWATTISQGFSAAAVTLVLMRREDACRFVPRLLQCSREPMWKIIRIGLPAGIQGGMFAISNVVIQSSINSFGDVMVSGNAAVSNIEGFCYVTVNGVHQTAVNFLGQNTGAMQFDRVKKSFRICLAYGALFGTLIGGFIYLFREPLLGIYITDSPEAIAIGAERILLTSLPYGIYGIQDVITGAMRGIGASFSSMVLSILGICGVRILWISTVFRIPEYHTPTVLYLSYLISWVVTLAVQYIGFRIAFRRLTGNTEK